MADLISRQAVISKAFEDMEAFRAAQFQEWLDELSPVDAVEVVHGRWEKKDGLYSCSECGKVCPYDVRADIIEYWTCNFCPNCGADMRGGTT